MDRNEAIEILKEEKSYAEEGYYGELTSKALTFAIETLNRIDVRSLKEIVASFIKPLYKEAGEQLNQNLDESCSIQIHNITQAIINYLNGEGK